MSREEGRAGFQESHLTDREEHDGVANLTIMSQNTFANRPVPSQNTVRNFDGNRSRLSLAAV